jgi:NAD(P)-dependent dehydrogenase (short-subunit alcohol dehydrogenase family)
MTRNLALELGRYGITVNNILPGAIVTGMTSESFQQENIADIWARKSPLKRLGQPIDIANGALFLASDESSFVTGHDFHIDGGMLLKQ